MYIPFLLFDKVTAYESSETNVKVSACSTYRTGS